MRSYAVCKETDAASALSSELVPDVTTLNCGQFLQKALLKTPSDGRLWLEIARNLSQNNGETSEIIRALKLSYQFAPREQWIAIIRTGFAISIWAALPDDVQQLTRNELKELLPNYSYRQGLAKIYTKKPFSRKTISLLMLDQSNEVQKQFLGALRFELRSPN